MENEFINWKRLDYRKPANQIQNITTAVEDKKQHKKNYNKNYYAKTSRSKKILKNQELLSYYKKQLGDNLLIDANMLNEPGFDWKVVTDLIQHEGHMYRCIGSLAYTVFDNNKIKIISI